MENLKVVHEEIKVREDKSPIFFVNITGEIKNKLNSKKVKVFKAHKIVVKGTLDQIYKSETTKKKFIADFFKRESASKKKVNDFDLSKITITNIEIIRGLGYGIKLK